MIQLSDVELFLRREKLNKIIQQFGAAQIVHYFVLYIKFKKKSGTEQIVKHMIGHQWKKMQLYGRCFGLSS